jgi:hypothetical protein
MQTDKLYKNTLKSSWAISCFMVQPKTCHIIGLCSNAIEVSSLDFSSLKDEVIMLSRNTEHQTPSDVMPYPTKTETSAKNPHLLCLQNQGQQLLVNADIAPNNVKTADLQSRLLAQP